ncbi:MAG TPA: TonB-dependent receptor [Terracidiphilus sp.]
MIVVTTEEVGARVGEIIGVVKDPSGAMVAGAKIHIRGVGFAADAISDRQGRFEFASIPIGRYRIEAVAQGFELADISAATVTASGKTPITVILRIASAQSSVEVKAPLLGSASATALSPGQDDQAHMSNAARLLSDTPGISVRENGTLGSIPLLHGLGDERTKVVVDGMTISSACPNHMNPPSSYMAPAHAAQMTVMPGVTPVSSGGDSLGGTISIDSADPVFARGDERLRATSSESGFFRSNGENYGGSLSVWAAGHNLAFGYGGSWATEDDYKDGSGHKVTSTFAQTTEHALTFAMRARGNLLVLQGALHHVPYEGFPNSQMDMVRDYAESLNLHFRHGFEHGSFDSHVYWQGAWHSMNVGRDKSTFPMPMWMPMNTHGRDLGYTFAVDVPVYARHNLNLGNELHRFVLDDGWPAVPGTAPGMGPNPFVHINQGHRARLGSFAEITSAWNSKWMTLVGLRNDSVWMNTGAVQGYSMMYAVDADAFNASHRARLDTDLDATAWARFQPNTFGSYELGFARKSRAPNLYERYAWSTSRMTSGMIGWFGDGNAYVGNLNLRPETANTLSGTASWSDTKNGTWEIKVIPFLTSIHDFVDVDLLKNRVYGTTTLAQLRFANRDVRIAGADLSGSARLWQNGGFGYGKVSLLAALLHGKRLDTSTGLYQMMPPHLSVDFNEEVKTLSAGFKVQAVSRKTWIDPNRHEPPTSGYGLLDVHAGYRRGHIVAAAAADNLLNRNYELPLGGVNFDDFMSSGWTGQLKPLTGRGRLMFATVSARF